MEDLSKYTKEELQELVNVNAEGLSKTHGMVYGLLLNTAGFDSEDGEWVIGYFKAPTLYQKMTIIDRLDVDKTLKGFQLLKQNLIKENSDPRLTDERNEKNHRVIIGASLTAANMCVDFSINQTAELKKNGK